jgi:poly(ADP-ribose) glycohydrolase ARH3
MDYSDLRFHGALLGVAVGDALGAPFEGQSRVDPGALVRILTGSDRLTYTDDTHMTLGVLESLVACDGQLDGRHLADTFIRNFEKEPWRGYGAGPPRVFRRIREGVPWDEAGRLLFGGAGSYGNGAAMRVAPIALRTCGDLRLTVQWARLAGSITHTHELALQGACLQACAIALLLKWPAGNEISPAHLLAELRRVAEAPLYDGKLTLIQALLPSAPREEVILRLGHGISAYDSVPTALYCFLRHSSSFSEVIQDAICLGGDTDTIASMAGALAGAYLGEKAIPQLWITRLQDPSTGQDVNRITDWADRLFSLMRTDGVPATNHSSDRT